MQRSKQQNVAVDPPRSGRQTGQPGTRFADAVREQAGELDKVSDTEVRRELQERHNGSGE